MTVDVLYEGLTLQSGAQAREETDGTFIELEAPMPVGTQLTVRGPEGERSGRVAHVREGMGSGVLVKFENGAAPTKETGEHEAITADGDGSGGEKKKKKKKKG
jgi:hypothetical protein